MLSYGPEPCLKDLGVFGTLEIFHCVFCKCQKCQGITTLRRQNIKPGQDSCSVKDHGSFASYPSRSLEAGQRAPGGEPSNSAEQAQKQQFLVCWKPQAPLGIWSHLETL